MQVNRPAFLAAVAAFCAAPRVAGAVSELPPHQHGLNGARLPLDRPIELHIRVLDGPDFALSSQRGNVVILNFFATWCPACRQEADQVVAFAAAHANDTFVLSVDVAEADDTVRAWRKKYAVTYPMAMDERGAYFANIGLKYYPSTLIFRPDGKLSCVFTGSMGVDDLETERRHALDLPEPDADASATAPTASPATPHIHP